jgi:hypothetical protein
MINFIAWLLDCILAPIDWLIGSDEDDDLPGGDYK